MNKLFLFAIVAALSTNADAQGQRKTTAGQAQASGVLVASPTAIAQTDRIAEVVTLTPEQREKMQMLHAKLEIVKQDRVRSGMTAQDADREIEGIKMDSYRNFLTPQQFEKVQAALVR